MTSFDKFIQPDITLTIEARDNSFELSYRGTTSEKKGIKLSPTVAKDKIKQQMVLLREDLSRWAKRYDELLDQNKKDRLSCDPSKVKAMWNYLATEGRKLYRMLFALNYPTDANLVELSKAIRDLDPGSTIELDMLDAPLPWGLLYDGDIPPFEDPDYFQNLIPHFWGIRYQLVAHPIYGVNNINNKPYLLNTDGTRLTIAVNQQSDTDYQTGQMTFFKNIEQKFKTLNSRGKKDLLMLGTSKEEVVSSLTKRQEPQHLYYFFCHHEKGEGETNIYGIEDLLQKTQIIMEGEKQGVLTLDELNSLFQDSKILPFQSPPVIFLNACHSNQLKMGDPTSFMTYFITGLRSWNFIGTEADIPAPFADAFGKRFVEKFLDGQTVGDILFDLRNHYSDPKQLNPFGLYYSLFGRGEIHLQHSVTESTS